jgi:hypothetical protein
MVATEAAVQETNRRVHTSVDIIPISPKYITDVKIYFKEVLHITYYI